MLERSAILEDNEVFTPENDRSDSDARQELEKNARVEKELRKMSPTNPAGAKESVNLPRKRSQKPTLSNARQKYQTTLEEMSTALEEYLSLHKPQDFIQEDERPEASRRFRRMKNQWGTMERR